MNSELKKQRKVFAKHHIACHQGIDPLALMESFAKRVRKLSVNGYVGIHITGSACDTTKDPHFEYKVLRAIPTLIRKFIADEHECSETPRCISIDDDTN